MPRITPLKDGSRTTDGRLTRLVNFDKRSRGYGIRETIEAKKPRSYTWRCDKVLDQGEEGACVGASMTHELIARPAEVTGLTMKFAREKVYWEAQKIDPWPGGSYPGASPSYEGTSVLAGIKTLQRYGYISEYRWAFGLKDLIMAVGYKGPAVLGLVWYEGMFEPHSCGHLHIGGDVIGGHAILCNGVDVPGQRFRLHNSWGTRWGDRGEAWVSFDEMEELLYQNGEAVIPLGRTANP